MPDQKIKNALLSTVTARDRNGKRVVGIPRIVGSYTSSIIAAETWYPERYDWKDGVRNGTFSFATSAAFNLYQGVHLEEIVFVFSPKGSIFVN